MTEAIRRRFTVLVVEDDPGDVRLVRGYLAETSGVMWDIECVEQLAEAVERLKRGGIDVVLLDLHLPDSVAISTVEKVRAAAPRVPVVVLTGLGDELIGLQALRSGAQDFLVKGRSAGPLLVRVLRHAVERTRARNDIEDAMRCVSELRERARRALAALSAGDGARGDVERTLTSLESLDGLLQRTMGDLGLPQP
jgi:CheY-like chemotaxis protein